MQRKLTIIGSVHPEPQSTAAGLRMMQLIELFKERNYSIHFLSTSLATEFSENLEEKGVSCNTIVLNNNSINKFLFNHSPDIVLFDRFMTEEQFGWKVAEICPTALRIIDTEDLHFLRKARENAFKKGKNVENAELQNDYFLREIASILRSDLSLIISDAEMNILRSRFKIEENILHYIPIFGEISRSDISFKDRQHFVSIGNFLHEPNWQTVLQLKQIWPEIKKQLPHAEMHIYGAYCPPKAFQLDNEDEGFIVKGRAENIEEVFLKAKLLLAPIPFGAGIKGKLLKSMELGLPNVTTIIGAEGMGNEETWNGFIAIDDKDFIQKAVTLYIDEENWLDAQKKGYDLVKSKFDKELYKDAFFTRLHSILDNLEKHREQNFLGKILQHHNLHSTKYMSKWIEEKNKK